MNLFSPYFEETKFYLSKDKQIKVQLQNTFGKASKSFATFNHFPFLNLDIANSKKEKRNKN